MGFDIVVRMDSTPSVWDESKGDHYTGLQIEPDEWNELFLNVLQAPEIVTYIEGENSLQYSNRLKKVFQETLASKGYEMLGRIWNFYKDAYYFPSEVKLLLAECLKLQKKTQNEKALSVLAKLVSAGNEALKINSGVWLASD